jgi:hypothetical protein
VIYRIKNKYNLLATRGIQIDVVNFYGCLLKALNLLQLFEFFYRWRLLLKRSKQFKAAFKTVSCKFKIGYFKIISSQFNNSEEVYTIESQGIEDAPKFQVSHNKVILL